MNWQPIESAPKDGTSVLLVHPVQFLQSITVGWFTAGKWRDEACLNLEPTHWMPLPDLPVTAQPPRSWHDFQRDNTTGYCVCGCHESDPSHTRPSEAK